MKHKRLLVTQSEPVSSTRPLLSVEPPRPLLHYLLKIPSSFLSLLCPFLLFPPSALCPTPVLSPSPSPSHFSALSILLSYSPISAPFPPPVPLCCLFLHPTDPISCPTLYCLCPLLALSPLLSTPPNTVYSPCTVSCPFPTYPCALSCCLI